MVSPVLEFSKYISVAKTPENSSDWKGALISKSLLMFLNMSVFCTPFPMSSQVLLHKYYCNSYCKSCNSSLSFSKHGKVKPSIGFKKISWGKFHLSLGNLSLFPDWNFNSCLLKTKLSCKYNAICADLSENEQIPDTAQQNSSWP